MMNRTPMKRAPFKSRGFVPIPREERVRQPLSPIRAPRPSAPIFSPTPKTEYVRDEIYRRYVAGLSCFECGIAGISQAAHSNQGGAGKGLSIKASDAFLFPLCADQPLRLGCHSKHDRCIDMTNDMRLARETDYLQRMAAINAKELACNP